MKTKIHVIAEGNEEETFLKIVKDYGNVNDAAFEFTFENAKSCFKIAPLFIQAYQSGRYDCVLAMYDVDDNKPETYGKVKEDLLSILGSQRKADEVSLCTNPNTVQLFIAESKDSDLCKTYIGTSGKSSYSSLLHSIWPEINDKKPYDARKYQLDIIYNSFADKSKYSYSRMEKNISALSEKPLDKPGTNIMYLLCRLVSKKPV